MKIKFKYSLQKTLYIIIIFFTINSCNYAQTVNKDNIDNNKNTKDLTQKYTVFKIEEVPDITQKNVTSAEFIKKRLEQLIGKSMKQKCDSLEVNYPPQFVLFRMFKLEKEFEIWIGNSRQEQLKLLAILPVCAVDPEPGTKIREGDGKTPEGFYNCTKSYGSSYGFMWINLNNNKLDEFGEVGSGFSSFKICTDYPHSIDILRTKKTAGNAVSAGGAICIHGNCVTAGCISFKNRNFLPVFLSIANHNEEVFGEIKVHIFPFRFTEDLKSKYSKSVNSEMNPEELVKFWNQLEIGYKMFEVNNKALNVSYSKDKYIFKSY